VDGRAGRRRLWGWYLFDWANQPYNTLLLTFIFAPYFVTAVAPDPVSGQAMWGTMLAITGTAIALLAPVLGAVADTGGSRRGWLVLFSALYVGGAFALWWAAPGLSAAGIVCILVAFGIGMVGLEFGIVFTNAYLPEIARGPEIGRVSGAGWAMGYAGGVASLAVILLAFAENESGRTLAGVAPALGLDPAAREGTRAAGPFTALWYLVFVIPFFLWVPGAERPRSAGGDRRAAIRRGLSGLATTVRALHRRRSLAAYLGGSMLWRDGLNGIYAFGGLYAAGVLGWSVVQIGIFGIVAAVVGAAAAWAGGRADARLGPRPVIARAIVALIAVCLVVLGTSREMVLLVPVGPDSILPDLAFYLCGAAIGSAGGILQSASRTMMVRQADPARMTEAFGLYALSGKATAFLAPALVAAMTAATGDQRLGVAPLILLFLAGLVLLSFVRPEGERAETWAASRIS
jgi:UMF1 family MFS transporter